MILSQSYNYRSAGASFCTDLQGEALHEFMLEGLYLWQLC